MFTVPHMLNRVLQYAINLFFCCLTHTKKDSVYTFIFPDKPINTAF